MQFVATASALAPPVYNEAGARDFLTANGWPAGLQDTFVKNLSKIPIRYFICDDSGSMAANDGHKFITDGAGSKRLIDCSRWAELCESLKFHAGVARAANAPTEFRTLNSLPPVMIGTDDPENTRYHHFIEVLGASSPGGGTPLCSHIREVTEKIKQLAPMLRSNGQRACVAIFTDGESSDGDLAAAMKPLEQLPVWVVVRVCTDDEKITTYWNNIDGHLELDMDVLDDLQSEAEEIREKNPWLTYGEPMHRLREFGIPVRELDLLDEQALSLDQLRVFCSVLYGGSVESYPHPQIAWNEFVDMIKAQNALLPKQWNPLNGQNDSWIPISKLKKAYHKNGSCTVA